MPEIDPILKYQINKAKDTDNVEAMVYVRDDIDFDKSMKEILNPTARYPADLSNYSIYRNINAIYINGTARLVSELIKHPSIGLSCSGVKITAPYMHN